jgi:AAA domain-containing protein
MVTTPNGTAAPGYTAEALDQFTAAGAVLTWEDLGYEERLAWCLANPQVEEWLSDDALDTFASFRRLRKEWVRILAGYRRLGGDGRLLTQAVDGVLADEAPSPIATALVTSVDLLGLTLPPKAPYLDWLTERSLTMVYGPRGVGKTLWMLELAISLTMPKPFLKWPVRQQVRVMYVDGEMTLDALQDRLRQLAGDYPPPGLHFLPSELVYARAGRDLTLTGAADRLAIDTMLDATDSKVLILDNVSCLFPGLDESKKQDWEPINAWLIRLRHRGITALVGHHAGKNGQQRGTSGREDALDTVIALTMPPGHQAQDGCHLHMRFEKSRGIKGATVESLDVRLEDMTAGPAWTYAPLDARRKERIQTMLEDGMPAKLIADELGTSASYIYRCKRELGL